MAFLTSLWGLLLQLPLVANAAANQDPTVRLDHATVTGIRDGSVERFLGIPYAQPPVGNLRLQLPQLVESYNGSLNATAFGNQCFQEAAATLENVPPEVLEGLAPALTLLGQTSNVTQSEDCLYINVVRPADVSTDAKLPVLFWIYGGGFADGSNAIPAYNGTAIVERSIQLGEPVIYVALNYRLHVFGFLGGKEIKDAGLGNLGLQDQRVALRWVNKFITAFGGDPSRVTIWGESAGSISVYLQLFADNGKTDGLFRAGIMSSGFATPAGYITDVQDTYDFVVEEVGCSNATDTLACLRTVPADNLLAAANATPPIGSYPGVSSAFLPRADGQFVPLPPLQLSLKAQMADVPIITGDCKDEATLFSFASTNVTTDDEFASYLTQFWFPGASTADLSRALQLYPSDPAAGSPAVPTRSHRSTSVLLQSKGIGSSTDLVDCCWTTSLPSGQRTTSTFGTVTAVSARGNFTGLGDFHGTDLLIALTGGDMADYFIRFVNHLDPNPATGVQWPLYNTSTRSTLQFNDGSVPLNITADDQRLAGIQELTSLALRFPL